jgi:diketogulonate reductase-like aldo/keto reductase
MLNINSKTKLNNGTEIPVIGLGVWKLVEGEEVENAVKYALDAGYRMIDTAMIYENEAGVGRAIKNSGLAREDIFITTKLWNEDQGYESALKAIDTSLVLLGLDYADLYLIHWPAASDIWAGKVVINKREETWKAMEEIYGSGKAKAIGVSNYTIRHLEEMKAYAKIPPMVDQVEFNPFLYQKDLLKYCREHNIVLEAYSPLFHGERLNDEKIGLFAKKYNKSNAQILIRWSLQHGCVVIPKSAHKDRITQNIDVFDFEISSDDMEKIDALNHDLHLRWDPSTID